MVVVSRSGACMPDFIKKRFNHDTGNSQDEDYAARIKSEREFYLEFKNARVCLTLFATGQTDTLRPTNITLVP